MIRKVLWWILVYALVAYGVVTIGSTYDFFPFVITPAQSIHNIPFFLILGGVFWLVFDVIRYILKLLTIPFNMFSFGAIHLFLNVGVLYLIPVLINKNTMGVTITMGTFMEVALLAIVLSIIGLFVKYL